LTGRENLEIHRRLLGLPKGCIEEAMDTVELIAVGDRLVRNYSSGMKQRLGLAQALLGKPELLLLDEPTNELDPAGIREVRTLVHDLPQRCGVTVFLSSHLLSEVEQVAMHLAIIAKGRLMFEGARENLLKRSKPVIVVEVDQPERAQALLSDACGMVTREGNHIRIEPNADCGPAAVNAILVKAGLAVSQLVTEHPTLEEFFLNLTSSPVPEKECAIQ
jgi:ABC-type multidrug transport system ATPase subunit